MAIRAVSRLVLGDGGLLRRLGCLGPLEDLEVFLGDVVVDLAAVVV